ncbi:MAG: tetratricopeptide repeat protein [Acidobacteriota bacterium]
MNPGVQIPRWLVPALGGLVLLSLGVSLAGDFVWDDRPLIVENALIKNVDRLDEILTRGFTESGDDHDRFRSFFRPVIGVSYFVDHTIWGLKPFGFHLTNLLLHFACCLLVLRLGLDERLDPRAAFAGAALFAVHPVHVESVAWISGRTDLIACAFVLGALVCHTRRGNGRTVFRLASWMLFAVALYSKEMAVTFPVIVFASGWLRAAGNGRWRCAIAASAPFFVILGLYMASRSSVLGGQGEPFYTLEPLAWIATGMFVVARYLTLLLLPLGLDGHYPYPALETLLDPRAVIGAAMLALVGFAAWRLARAKSPALFWLVWAGLTLTPVLIFGRFGNVLLADRFLYLPSVGAALLAAYGVHAAQGSERSRRRVFATVGLAIVLLGGLAASRSRVWANDHRLFSAMLETSPRSALVHNNLGMALYHREDLPGAIDHFRTAIEFAPEYALASNNLAAALHRTGRKEEALSHYRKALELSPGLMMAGANAGHLLVELGRTEDGLALLRGTVRLHPQVPPVLYALADGLYLVGRPDEAIVWLKRIRTVDPEYAESFYLLGKIHFEAGRLNLAAEQMSRFIERQGGVGPRAEFARSVVRRAGTRAASGL